jgi:hypothetical protein
MVKLPSLFLTTLLATAALAKSNTPHKINAPNKSHAPHPCIDLCNKYGKGQLKWRAVCNSCVQVTPQDVAQCGTWCRDQRLTWGDLRHCEACLADKDGKIWVYPEEDGWYTDD